MELRSCSDALASLQAKMEEYMEHGARLGWLIDPQERTVYIYGPQSEAQRLDNPTPVSGEPLLPGFCLKVRRLWA